MKALSGPLLCHDSEVTLAVGLRQVSSFGESTSSNSSSSSHGQKNI